MLSIGDLRDRVVIQQSTETTPADGARAVSWSALATVWAQVQPWEGQTDESMRAAAVTPTARYKVVIRYRPDVTAAMRLLWRPFRTTSNRVLEIQAVSLIGRQWLRLDCIEGTT